MGEADDYTYYRLFQRIEIQHFPQRSLSTAANTKMVLKLKSLP